jgi:hypothetical protein
VRQRPPSHDGDVDVAAPVDIAAEGPRAREVDADELLAEEGAEAFYELVEVAD